MKENLLDKLAVFLLKEGFTIKRLTRTCFDALARKNDTILLIKLLEDANSIGPEFAEEMKKISSYVNGSPIILSEKAGNRLEDNVVYSRFDVYTLNLNTFKASIHNKYPFIKSSQAGLTASVIGKKLKEKREELGLSLSNISKKIGVSARMVSKYEDGNSEITLNKAFKIYDIFGHEVFNKIDIFSVDSHMDIDRKSDLTKHFSDLGFNAAETKRVPFDIIAKRGKEIILTEVGDKRRPDSDSISKLVDADNLVIFNKKKPKDIPAMTKKEFMDFEKANELIKFLKEFYE